MSLRDLKRRISSIKDTSKITKAMSLISSVQLKKLRQSLNQSSFYRDLISQITYVIAFENRKQYDVDISHGIIIPNTLVIDASRNFLHKKYSVNTHQPTKELLVIMSSDKGLCGSFNVSIFNEVIKLVHFSKNKSIDILCVGKKGYENLSKHTNSSFHILDKNVEIQFKDLSYNSVMGKLTKPILELIESSVYSSVKVIYTEFQSMLKQEVITKQLFPLVIESKLPNCSTTFDSKPSLILKSIIPNYLQSIIFNCILNSLTSESVKRMMTMDNASSNSKDILNNLNLEYNRKRQTKVTMELIEVISGMQSIIE